jgi:hypothetical protein
MFHIGGRGYSAPRRLFGRASPLRHCSIQPQPVDAAEIELRSWLPVDQSGGLFNQDADPERDLEVGMIMLVHMETEESTLKRGWELSSRRDVRESDAA